MASKPSKPPRGQKRSGTKRQPFGQVQNTFISIVSPRSETQPSLSCPASRIGCLKALFCEDADAHDTPYVSKDVPEKELGNVGNVEVEASPTKIIHVGGKTRMRVYYIYIYTCINIYIYIHTYIYTYIYIYIYLFIV